MKASEDALLNEAKASAVANDAIIPRRPHRGGGREGVSPIKNREQFFRHVEEGLQQYFDECDRQWGGILHLTVGVRHGTVGGVIKSENTLRYEGYTRHRIERILRYVLPRYVPRKQVDFVVADFTDELLDAKLEEESAPEEEAKPEVEVQRLTEQPLPKRRRGRKQKTSINNQTQENNENNPDTISDNVG